MADNGRGAASQDPLESYRKALRRQQSTGSETKRGAQEPPAPEPRPATEGPLELGEPLVVEEPAAQDEPSPAAGRPHSPGASQAREHIPDESTDPAHLTEEQRAEAMLNRLSEQIRLGVDGSPAADKPLERDEPLAADEPLDLGEPLEAEEPLDLGAPLESEEPLDLGAPLELDQPIEAADTAGSAETRTAADWLGLDEELGEEDPLGLEEPRALDAASQPVADDAPGGVAADDEVPEELQGTLARYQMAMSKLRSQDAPDTPDPLAEPAGPSEPLEAGPGEDDELLGRYRRARRRQQDFEDDVSEPAPVQSASRKVPERFSAGRTTRSDMEDADELVRDFPAKARVTRRSRQRSRQASRATLGWSTRAVTFAALLFAALPVQWLVYRQLGTSFALEDLGAGLSALLPAALILLLARPASARGQVVMVLGSVVVGLIGSAGFAYGLSLLQNQLPQGTSLVFRLLLSLGLFTAVWGPLFLILVPILSRLSRPARGNT